MAGRYSRIYGMGLVSLMALTPAGLGVAQPPTPPVPPAVPPVPLPQLPPPERPLTTNERAPEPHVVTRVPVELRIAIDDLQQQVLRTLLQKVNPQLQPVLPFVIKGNEPQFALGENGGLPGLPKPGGDGAAVVVPPARAQLIPREPGMRPRLDRLASRPLVRVLVDQMLGTVDLTYRIELRSFKLSVSGNTLISEIGAGFHCETQPVGAGPAAPPANVRDIGLKLLIAKNLSWNASGKLELTEGTSSIWIDPDAPIVGFPRLDIERVVRLNGILALTNATLDRELMKRFTGENLPDLNVIAPTLNQKIPLMACTELTAYPIRGDNQHVYFPFVLSLVPAHRKSGDAVAITAKTEPAPEATIRGRIKFDKDGKPEVKLDPTR